MAPDPEAPRTFRRTGGTRLLSAACSFLFIAGTILVVFSSGVSPGFFILAGLSLISVASAVGAWADRYTLSASGLEYRNALLAGLGARPLFVPWEQVAQVREHRSLRLGRPETRASALSLVLRSGRRVVLDSLVDFEEVLATVRRHCALPQ